MNSPSEENDASALLRAGAEKLGLVFPVSEEALEQSFNGPDADSIDLPAHLSAEALWASFHSAPAGIPVVMKTVGEPDSALDSAAEGLKLAARNGADLSEEVRQQMESDRHDREAEEG